MDFGRRILIKVVVYKCRETIIDHQYTDLVVNTQQNPLNPVCLLIANIACFR